MTQYPSLFHHRNATVQRLYILHAAVWPTDEINRLNYVADATLVCSVYVTFFAVNIVRNRHHFDSETQVIARHLKLI